MSSLEIILRIIDAKTGEPIVFKVDGARFDASMRTLKFCIGEEYLFQIQSIPEQKIQSVTVFNTPLQLSASGEPNSYTWQSDAEVTKKGSREYIPVQIQGELGNFNTKLQAKLYPSNSSAARGGSPVMSVTYKCVVQDKTVKITEETLQ